MDASDPTQENIFSFDTKTLTNSVLARANESIVKTTLSSAQYIESSLSLGAKINSHFTLKGGLSVGRFLNADYKIDKESKSIFKALGNNQPIENINLNQANTILKKWLVLGFIEADYQVIRQWALTSSISIGHMNKGLDYYEFSPNVSANGSTQYTSISFSQPEKGTINVSLGVKYNFY